jgi:ferredoxin-nitrate reductase
VQLPAKVTRAISPGTVFMPMHWGSLWADQAECNSLTHPEACPDSLQPELKACAVAITKVIPTRADTSSIRRSLAALFSR